MAPDIFFLGLVMACALTAYALLAGADYGGGVWDLFATGPHAARQRATIARAIGPVWEANHVWLILVVTVLFTGFPAAFAWLGTNLHLPIMLALIGIVLRGSAFVFRAYGPSSHEDRWGRVFAVASTVTPVLLGVLVGAITEGGTGGWLTPFSTSVGFFTLTLFTYLAAVYLTFEARESEVREAFRARALVSGVLVGVMALLTLLLAGAAPHVWEGLTSSPWAIPLHGMTAVAALGALGALWTRRYWWARTGAILQVTLIVWGWALTQYPYLIRPHLTLDLAAAPRPTRVLLVKVLSWGAAVVLPSLIYLFSVFGPRDFEPRGTDGVDFEWRFRMRKFLALSCVSLMALGIALPAALAQGDPDRVIPGGGISVQGWTGKIDASSAGQGRMLNDAKFAQEGANLHITTGPAVSYWNPANRATGDYTVKATFTEPKYMALNSHPHSYGIFIGGNDLGTDQQSLLYCAAYGNGTLHRARLRPGAVSDERRAGRGQSGGPQGRGAESSRSRRRSR